jgi:replicative DNA helicase
MGRMDEPFDEETSAPPNSLEAERGVLGGILKDPGTQFDKVAGVLDAEDFYRPEHQLIFEAIETLTVAGRIVDPVTVIDVAEQGGRQVPSGAVQYLRKLMARTDDLASVAGWAQIVKENAQRRQVMQACSETIARIRSGQGRTISELTSDLEARLQLIGDGARNAESTIGSVASYSAKALDLIQEAHEKKTEDGVTGVRTGLQSLDEETSGLQRGDLIILAARPSMGKTSLALQIAENVAMYEKLPVVVFSMEMGGTQLAMRQISGLARIDQKRLRSGDLREQEWSDLTEAVDRLSRLDEWIDTQGGLTASEMRSRIRQFTKKHGKPGLVVIDYLQLMTGKDDEKLRANEVAAISRALKAMAKELDVPVMALSQLNRSVELRPDKRPMMSDLRESGSLEQDADVILFIYRDDYYNADSQYKGQAEVIIGKQRTGPTGMVMMGFDKQHSRWNDHGRC